MITSEKMKRILTICSSDENVKAEVVKNHDNNLWWPMDITDKRMRLLIAGLSTRISYNMITTYQQVLTNLNKHSYEEIIIMDDECLAEIVSPLGLLNARMTYIKSMINFIENFYNELDKYSNEKLIELISKNVHGASYKVAQCCVLYLRGYYCGVMPVDSGMKDILLPCIGFTKRNGSIAHEVLRKELEEIVKKLELESIVNKNGYSELITIPKNTPFTWWSHLVLIYFKRFYCNKHKPDLCPLCKEYDLPCLCCKNRGTGNDNN